MPVKPHQIEVGKTYQLNNGTTRKVIEIVPDPKHAARDEVSEGDIIRYEAEKWGYDTHRFNGKTRVRVRSREKLKRSEFAQEASKQLD